MRKIFSLVFAGFFGGLIAFGLINYMGPQEALQNTNSVPQASFTSTVTAPIGSVDFVEASKKTTAAVVHISASESKALAEQRYQNNRRNRRSPFDGFGMEEFFGGDFFGRNFFQPRSGNGSGVIISQDGYIVTNNHVVGFADAIEVVTADGTKYQATKIGTDPSSDLAVIKIEGENLQTVEYGNSDNVQVGEWVLAVGNPFSYLTSTVTAGIVSAKGRNLNLIDNDKSIEEFIQTDAAVNPGNSGGALVNTEGELIGINTAIATPTGVFAGYSFAIPSNLAKRIVRDIIENGDIERANLGIGGYDVNQKFAKENNLSTNTGFYVVEVDRGSSAQFAGLLPADVIVGANGKLVNKYEDLTEAIKFSKVGDEVDLDVIRNGSKKTIVVKLKKQL